MKWLISFLFSAIKSILLHAPTFIWEMITFKNYPPRRKWMWFILGIIFGGALTFYLTFPAYDGLRLLSDGVETRGRVLDKYVRTSTDDNGDTSYEYNVTYEFDAGLGDPPNMRQSSAIVNEDTYNRSILREQVTVRFLYENPGVNSIQPRVDYKNDLNRLLIVFGLYGLFLLVVTLNAIQVILRAVYRKKLNP